MRILVLLVAVLVIIPFVAADSLQIQLLSGKDGINGYAKSNDELALKVFASIEGDPAVTSEQVRISIDAATVFPQKCEASGAEFKCTYTEPVVNRLGTDTYGITLVDDTGEVVLQSGQQLVIDNSVPIIFRFNTEEITSGVGTIEYGIQDGADESICSGIRNIRISIADTVIAEKTFEPETCTAQEAISYEYKKSTQADLCISALDYLNQKTELCRKITMDIEPPMLISAGLYKDSRHIEFIRPEGGLFSLGVVLEDASGVKQENIIVSIDKITGRTGDIRIANRVVNNTYFIDNVPVNQNSACEGSITATDNTGHVLQTEFTCMIGIDTTGPEPMTIKTNFIDPNGGYLISTKNPKIMADIYEEGAGLTTGNVYLNLFSITGESARKADQCAKITKNIWRCEWNNLAITGKQGMYSVELPDTSTDDISNQFTKGMKADIDVTTLVTGIGELQQTPKSPSTADVLTFSFFVTPREITPTVLVNISAITKSGGIQKAQCEPAAEKWQCVLRAPNLKPTEPVLVEFVLSDENGNIMTEKYPVEVYESNPAQQKFFRISGLTISPPLGIDRRTATKANYPVTIQPFFFSNDKNVEILAQTVRCDEGLLADKPLVLNQNSKNPLVLLKFDTSIADKTDDVAKINCATSIIAKKERTVFTTPETLNFTAKIQLYNNPLGTIDESVQKKLDAVNLNIKSLEDDIRSWEGANNALGKIAGIAQTLAQTDAMMSVVQGILSVVSQVLITTGDVLIRAGQPAGAAIQGIGIAVWSGCSVANALHQIQLSAVWMPGPPTANNPLFKMAAFINSCQLCRHSGLLDVPVEKLTGQMMANIDGRMGVSTSTQSFTQTLWEPQKSIHVASLCLCPQGIEYNLKKERQLACIYKNCIKEHAKKGLPITNCDRTYKEQNCLYIDSAGWKVGGSNKLMKAFAAMTLTQVIEKIPEIISGLAWQIACHPAFGLMKTAYTCSVYPYGATAEIAVKNAIVAASSAALVAAAGGLSPAVIAAKGVEAAATAKAAAEATSTELIVCGLSSAPLMLMETGFLQGNQFDWDQYNADLLGEDYCVE